MTAGLRIPAGLLTGILIGISVFLGGCSSDDGIADEPSGAQTEDSAAGPTTDTPESGDDLFDGSWEPDPGQADTLESALSDAGFECSVYDDTSADVRMCAKGVDTSSDTYESVAMGRIRFLSAADGTVILAAIDTTASTQSAEMDAIEQAMLEGLLPQDDAAVALANGTSLSWGTVEVDPSSEVEYFLIDGVTAPRPLWASAAWLATNKEDALPALQDAGLECEFQEAPNGETRELACLDPTFDSENEDLSIEGATAETVLYDAGTGITRISVEGRHASVEDDARGIRELFPHIVDAVNEEPMADIQAWVEDHLDGLPHSAYVGTFNVTVTVVPSSSMGTSVTVVIRGEAPDFGAPSVGDVM